MIPISFSILARRRRNAGFGVLCQGEKCERLFMPSVILSSCLFFNFRHQRMTCADGISFTYCFFASLLPGFFSPSFAFATRAPWFLLFCFRLRLFKHDFLLLPYQKQNYPTTLFDRRKTRLRGLRRYGESFFLLVMCAYPHRKDSHGFQRLSERSSQSRAARICKAESRRKDPR